MNDFDVVIVGLGPSGSMAALLLDSYGIKVLAVDKEKDIYPLPRAVTISDQGFRMSQLVGIEDIYLQNSTELGGASFVNKDLEVIGGSIDLKGLISANGWPPVSLFHQPYTDIAIRQKLHTSNVKILLEHEFVCLSDEDENIRGKFLNSKDNIEIEFSCKYLIGADGGSSNVRKQLEISQLDLEYNRDWIVIDVELNGENRLGDKALQVCDKGRLATFIPSHLPFRRWEFLIHENEDKHTFLKDEKIQELISKWLKPDEYKIIRKAVYQFHSVVAKNFRKGNAFIIGDAAHQAPPFMGEGMMSGYRDAVNLCWKIALSIKNKLDTKLLDSFEVERIPHSKFVVENSAGIGELMEAYAEAKDPKDVSKDLVQKGYGSFILPNLTKGLFFGGTADASMHAGEIFPQPLLFKNNKIDKRMDKIFGKSFSLISDSTFTVDKETLNFLEQIDCKSIVLSEDYINDNSWLRSFLQTGVIYLVRPDRYVFGATNSEVSIQHLVEELRLRMNL